MNPLTILIKIYTFCYKSALQMGNASCTENSACQHCASTCASACCELNTASRLDQKQLMARTHSNIQSQVMSIQGARINSAGQMNLPAAQRQKLS